MPDQPRHRSLYAAFDRFPSAKGAATHIARMATTLFEEMDGGLLYVIGGEDLPAYQREGNVEIVRFEESVPNFLERTLAYGRLLAGLLERHGDTLEICHYRDPWSALPILAHEPRRYRTIYEVNGLPSIELPYTYPSLAPSTLAKIRDAEAFALRASDVVITPSATIAANLRAMGVDGTKITVIPNGADLPEEPPPAPTDAPARYILYIGALQRWQGIDVLMRAMTLLADIPDLHLVICSSTHPRRAKEYRRLAGRLGLDERIVWHHALSKRELGGWIAHAQVSVAPLGECSRNVQQGCAPLKILESMAHGVPVVASDLPAVREIIDDGVEGRLVRPDRPADLARAIRVLLEYPERARLLGANGRERIAREFTWDRSIAQLRGVIAAM